MFDSCKLVLRCQDFLETLNKSRELPSELKLTEKKFINYFMRALNFGFVLQITYSLPRRLTIWQSA